MENHMDELQQHVWQIIKPFIEEGARSISVAYSGGVDSHVLLDIVINLKSQDLFDLPIKTIHVHHGLSNNSDNWLNHCRQVSNCYAVEFLSEQVSVSTSGSIEENARKARYDVFEKHLEAESLLLQGHHQDDVIETFFMRAIRGSGLQGLASIPKQRSFSSANIVRPLLSIERASIQAYAKSKSLKWIEDESNADIRYERNWWRQSLLPQIWQKFGNKKQALIRTIDVLKRQQKVIAELLDPLYQKATQISKEDLAKKPWLQGSLNLTAIESYSSDLQNELLRLWLSNRNLYSLSAIQLQTICDQIVSAKADAQPVLKLEQKIICRHQNYLFCLDQDSYSYPEFIINDMSEKESGNASLHWLSARDIEKEHCQIRLKGRPTKSFKKIWQEHDIPTWYRASWPVLFNSDTQEVWMLAGVAIAEAAEKDGLALINIEIQQ